VRVHDNESCIAFGDRFDDLPISDIEAGSGFNVDRQLKIG